MDTLGDELPLPGNELWKEVRANPRKYANRLLQELADGDGQGMPDTWPRKPKSQKPPEVIPENWQQQATEGIENKRRRLGQ